MKIKYPLLKLVYNLTYAKLKLVSRLLWGIEIWPRHSFLTNAFTPMKSDLDLTAYVSNLNSLKSYLKFYNIYRKFFPFIGELNIYTDDCIRFIIEKDVNGFELERDPILVRRFSLDINNQRYFSREKAISYLLFTLINDLHKIKENPVCRIKKWKYHFDHINGAILSHKINIKRITLDENSLLFSVITAIVNLAKPSSVKQAELLRSKIRIYLDFFSQAKDSSNFIDYARPIITDENSDVLCFFIEYFSVALVSLPALDELQLEVMKSQMDWVIFRFLKQSYAAKDVNSAISNLKNFEKIINLHKISRADFEVSEILSKINSASEILNKRI